MTRPASGAALALLSLFLLPLPGGCRGDRAPAADQPRYTFRAEIVTLPHPDARRRQIALRHEAMPGFADESGKVVGMPAMVMPFGLDPSVSLDGMAAGDKVEATFAMDWQSRSMRIERLVKLPPGTALHY